MRALFYAALSLSCAAPALAASGAQEVAAALTAEVLIPRHRGLAEGARAFAAATRAFCTAPDAAGLDRVEAAFNDTADAWIAVEPVGFGPIELLMRRPRLYFWPDPSGLAAGDVADFLSGGDSADLDPEQFAGAAVSLQGLPAAEVLLYDGDAADHLLAADDNGRRRCALLTAVAGNVADLAGGLFADWTEGDNPFTATIAAPGPDNPAFANQDEVTTAFLKAIDHALQLAGDTRLKPVLGKDADAAKPERAEARRSGRSLRNIVLWLEVARQLYEGPNGDDGLAALAESGGADAEIGPLLRKAFRLTLETAKSVAKPLDEAVADPAERPKLEKLATQIQALRQLVGTRLAIALGLSVGLNALDGD